MIASMTIDREAIADHLDRNYKRRVGFVCIGSKDQTKGQEDFRHEFLQWPKQRQAVIDRLMDLNSQDRCVWVPTSLFHTRQRKDGETVPTNVLSFELDTVTLNTLELLNHLGADLIDSGRTGHLHVNIYFDRDLSGAQLKQRGRRLARACGVRGNEQGGKYGEGELLRPMGTVNTKAEARTQVTLRKAGRSRRRPTSVERFDSLVGWALEDVPDKPSRGKRADPAALVAQEVSRKRQGAAIRSMLRQPDSGDGTGRHKLTKKLVRLCNEGGLTQGEALWVLDQHEPSVAKFGYHRLAEQVVACWNGDTRAKPRQKDDDAMTDADDGDLIVEEAMTAATIARWLIEGWIPIGELTLVAGFEDMGKSTLCIEWAARTSRGDLPGEWVGRPRGVLYIATEDSWTSTVIPRLQAAGADRRRVFRVRPPGSKRSYVNAVKYLDKLREVVNAKDVGLIVFDPIASVLGDARVEKEEALRAALDPIINMAEECQVAVIGLKHFTKLESSDPAKLMGGNRAWSQIARTTIMLASDPENPEQVIVGVHKNNLSLKLPSRIYRREAVTVEAEGRETKHPRIVWVSETSMTPQNALAANLSRERQATNGPAAPRRISAIEWLETYLEDTGPTPRPEAVAAGNREQGFSDRTIDRAWASLKDMGRAIRSRQTDDNGHLVWALRDLPEVV